jgi:hypothetical protein
MGVKDAMPNLDTSFTWHEFPIGETFGCTPALNPLLAAPAIEIPPFGQSPSKTVHEARGAQLVILYAIWEWNYSRNVFQICVCYCHAKSVQVIAASTIQFSLGS